jgi:hypothetical protein
MRTMIREQFILLCKAQALIMEAIKLSECSPEYVLDGSVDAASGLIEMSIKDYAVSGCSIGRA